MAKVVVALFSILCHDDGVAWLPFVGVFLVEPLWQCLVY